MTHISKSTIALAAIILCATLLPVRQSLAATVVVSGTGLIGGGVSLGLSSNSISDGGGDGIISGGLVHSPSGAPDLFFRAADTPTFPGTLSDYVAFANAKFEVSGWEGSVDGTDNWMKVIRNGDGAVSWAQFTFDFQPTGPNDPILTDIPLYVTQTDGSDFTLAAAVAATAVPVPAAVWLFGSALGLLGWMRRKSA